MMCVNLEVGAPFRGVSVLARALNSIINDQIGSITQLTWKEKLRLF